MQTKNFFECNLPQTVPAYFHPDIYDRLQSTVDRVYARTGLLNSALQKSGLEPNVFHRLASEVFRISPVKFDMLSSDGLSQAVSLLWDGTAAPKREEWPNAIVLYDTAFVTTGEWELLRKFSAGGSDASVLMGLSPYTTDEALWYDKSGYPERITDSVKQAIFDRGHFLEPKVIEVFCRMTGAELVPETRMFRSKTHEHSTANLDAVLRMPSGKLAIFEAKSAIDCWEKISGWLGSNVPAYYSTQTYQYMGVMDDERIEGVYIGMLPCKDTVLAGTYVGSDYDASRYFHQFIARDPAFEAQILAAEDDFWDMYVIPQKKPAPAKDAKLDADARLKYRETPLTTQNVPEVELPFVQWQDQYNHICSANEDISQLKKQIERLENYRDTLRGEFMDAMGGAQEATLVDASGNPMVKVKNSAVSRETVDMDALRTYFPEAYEACKKTSIFTRFSMKDLTAKKKK